jgi:hypothetical protein
MVSTSDMSTALSRTPTVLAALHCSVTITDCLAARL